jgi:hypothetical protein
VQPVGAAWHLSPVRPGTPAGSDANPVIILNIRKGPDEPSSSLMVTDNRGRVHYATSSAAELLGLSPRQLIHTNIARFIPYPFNCLHQNLMQVRGSLAALFSPASLGACRGRPEDWPCTPCRRLMVASCAALLDPRR